MGANDEQLAVVAHGLLNPMAAVIGGIDLALSAGTLSPELELALAAARRQAMVVADSLRQLAQGLEPEVLAALDDLRRHEPRVAR